MHVSFYARLVHDLVNVVGRHARHRRSGCNVEHFSGQPAHLAHSLLLLLCQHGNLVPRREDLL